MGISSASTKGPRSIRLGGESPTELHLVYLHSAMRGASDLVRVVGRELGRAHRGWYSIADALTIVRIQVGGGHRSLADCIGADGCTEPGEWRAFTVTGVDPLQRAELLGTHRAYLLADVVLRMSIAGQIDASRTLRQVAYALEAELAAIRIEWQKALGTFYAQYGYPEQPAGVHTLRAHHRGYSIDRCRPQPSTRTPAHPLEGPSSTDGKAVPQGGLSDRIRPDQRVR